MKLKSIARLARSPFTIGLSTVVTVLLVAGCSALGISTDKVDYRKVTTQKPLDVPPELTPLPANDRFTVPGVATASGIQPARAQNAQGSVVPALPNARLERAGAQRWLAVDLPPEQVFPVVRDFWSGVGLSVARDDPKAGIVETEWAENRAKLPNDIIRRTIGRVLEGLYSTGEQDKYRARVERTAKNTSEVFISHRGMVEVYTSQQQDRTRWQPRPSDPELEAEMLQRLLLRFAPPEPQQTAAVASAPPAAAVPQVVRTVSGTDGRPSRIEIDEPFDRAWRRVGVGLDRGGFTVEDRDRTQGVYFVRYLDPEAEAKQRESQRRFVQACHPAHCRQHIRMPRQERHRTRLLLSKRTKSKFVAGHFDRHSGRRVGLCLRPR